MYVIQFIGSLLSMALLWLAGIFVLSLPFIFGTCVYRYVHARSQNKKAPGTYSDLEMKKRKLLLIVFSVLLGIPVALFVCLVMIMVGAIAFM